MKISKLIRFLKEKYGARTGAVHQRSHNPFETLISCVLSQRTRNEETEKASRKLFAVADTPEKILKLSDEELTELCRPAGFYRQKARKIKEICKILLDRYKGKVPDKREELMNLPGVGFKTSAVVMSYCFDDSFIPVDTHVSCIAKRLGFAGEKDDVETIRKKLEKLVPKKDRYHFHLELIHFGRDVCRTNHPKCFLCTFTKECLWFGKNKK